MRIASNGNVFIGSSTNSSDDGNVNISTPDSTFYVRGPRVAGSTTNITFRGGLEGNGSGKVRLWLTADAAHSSYIESIHVGNGDTNLILGTSFGNSLPTERMRIRNNGNTEITTGNLTCNEYIQIFTSGGGFRLGRPDSWVRLRNTSENVHLDFAAGQLYSHSTITSVGDTNISGNANVSGNIRHQTDRWHTSSDGISRLWFGGNSTTFISGQGSGTVIEFRSNRDTMRARLENNGQFGCHFLTIPSLNTDDVGVAANTGSNAFGFYYIHVIFNTFTGFHRCYYEDDEIFNNDMFKEDIDIFKNNYSGRIVISTGKIKTDLSRSVAKEEEENEVNRPINFE